MSKIDPIENQIISLETMWDLFREAVQTAKGLRAPPRSRYPGKSAMPEAPDEISPFAIMAAYRNGEILDMPETAPARCAATRQQIDAHDEVMGLFHGYAFRKAPRWKRKRMIVWDYASGARPRQLRVRYGVHRQRVHVLKCQAMTNMCAALRAAHKKDIDVLGIWGQ